jgi:hypothetical protein
VRSIGTLGSTDSDRNYKPSPRGDIHHTVRYLRPERQYGSRRCRGEFSVAEMTGCVPIVLETPLRVDERHRLLRADVLSPSSAVTVGGQDFTNRQIIQRARRGPKSPLRNMEVPSRGLEIGMTEQELDDAQNCASIQHVSGKGMSHHVDINAFLDARLFAEFMADLPDAGPEPASAGCQCQ